MMTKDARLQLLAQLDALIAQRDKEARRYYYAGRQGNALGIYQEMVKEIRALLAAEGPHPTGTALESSA